MTEEFEYYTTEEIDEKNAVYNVIFGERSNGKTYALLKRSIEEYWESEGKFAYVRRWLEDIRGRRAAQLFSGINANKEVASITNGSFDGVHYYAGGFYLCTYDDDGKVMYNPEDCIGHTFALSTGEHDKSTSFPKITTIIFDEFLTNRLYLKDEFVLFMNTVSTIVRKRSNVKIYMLGNTVSRHSPYFGEMGLTHVQEMEQGTIDVYDYGETGLSVAVEYCASTKSAEGKSNKYFAFDNPKLNMITGGSWELDLYAKKPSDYSKKDVRLRYFIIFNGETYTCDIVETDGVFFTYVYIEDLNIPNVERDLIYDLNATSPRLNIVRSIFRPTGIAQKRVQWFITTGRVFYENNVVGDAINSYLQGAKNV